MTASVRYLKSQISKEPGFFGALSPNKQILRLAGNADSLEHIEKYIRDVHEARNPNLQATLLFAISIAISKLDTEMADKIFKLFIEFYPKCEHEALQVAEQASPLENETTKTARENANSAAIKKIFDAYIKSNEEKNLQTAKDEFQTFMLSIQPKEIEDNLYYKNLIHLHSLIYKLFLAELASSKYKKPNDQIKNQARRFLIEILGKEIQSKLPPRILQILEGKLEFFINTDVSAPRNHTVDLFTNAEIRKKLGVDYYFAFNGKSDARILPIGPGSARYYAILSLIAAKFYAQICQRPSFLQFEEKTLIHRSAKFTHMS